MLKKPSDVTVMDETNRSFSTADYPEIAKYFPRVGNTVAESDIEAVIRHMQSRSLTNAEKMTKLKDCFKKLGFQYSVDGWSYQPSERLLVEYSLRIIHHQIQTKLSIAKLVKALRRISAVLK